MNNKKCPNCGAEVRYYHGTETTRVVCKEKCQGWKVIKEIDRCVTNKNNNAPYSGGSGFYGR